MNEAILESRLLKSKAFIANEWVDAASGKRYEVRNPATGDVVASVPDMNASDTKRAIAAAEEAFRTWRSTTVLERSRILRRWNDLVIENVDELARLLTTEMGKPVKEAAGEIRYGASFIEWFAEEARRVYGDVIPASAEGRRIVVIKQPVGVVGAITPWNFPNAMITRKIAPAIAAGCTAVVKPAEDTPLSALALAALARDAGLPPGVLNIVTTSDPGSVGGELTSNPMVKKVSFTGSTEVGKLLMRQSADTVKKVSLELGGNAPFIVFDDADIDEAVKGAVAAKYRNAGQTCVCANRIFAQETIYDAFVEKLAAAVKELKVGNGMQPGVTIGPLINRDGMDKVQRLVSDAVDKGAHPVVGGSRIADGDGYFFEPTVLSNVDDSMALNDEEIFGPVAPVYRFSDEADAIRRANNTRYGLAAYFYGRDVARVWRVAEALEYGMVGINTGLMSTAEAPFGGVKESGIGREGSKYGIEEYVEIKYLCFDAIS
ncbi:MAG: NAD-dependent succinate-semialdehyde dehydrogenase [Bacteroidetes bacterium]|nr:NAD-dependent succinate-semialdehyde dehydrogenase [Bacteroidota bacterium]